MRRRPPVEVGFRFGLLTVIAEENQSGRQRRFRSLCDCGNTTVSFAFSLKDGSAKSCGCVAARKAKDRWKTPTPEMFERLRNANKNRTHGLSKHAIYRAWSDMICRCTKPKHKWFPSYGGRGITVCERWMSSESFIADMLPTWQPGLQLGRRDNNGHYEPNNCRWETPQENQNNKSNSAWIETPDGRMTVSQAAQLYGLSNGCLTYRWSVGKRGLDLVAKSQRA